mgnify:CR=1 FL=1
MGGICFLGVRCLTCSDCVCWWGELNLLRWQVLNSFAHHRLPTSNALIQHGGSFRSGCCQVPPYAQGSHFWDQCWSVTMKECRASSFFRSQRSWFSHSFSSICIMNLYSSSTGNAIILGESWDLFLGIFDSGVLILIFLTSQLAEIFSAMIVFSVSFC